MPNYKYKAVDDSGKIYMSTVKFDSKQEVINHIKTRNLMPFEIKQVNIMTMDLNELKIFKPKVILKELSIFCRQFSIIIESGITVGNALDILRHHIENKTLKNIIQSVYESVQKGNTLSDSMSEYSEFPIFMISMLKVGEASGNLNLVLKQLADQYDKDLATERKIKTAMTYPIIVSILMLVVIIIILAFVVPSYIGMFEEMGAELPIFTLALISLSSFMIDKWHVILIFIFTFAILFKLFINSNKGRYIWDSIILKLPIIGKTIVKINTLRFSRTMGILLNAGVPIIESLEIVHNVITNVVIRNILEYAIKEVRQGVSLAEPIKSSNLFPYMLGSMISIGENTSTLYNVLYKTADFYDQEVSMSIEQMTNFIEPIITITIAIVMGFIMLAIVMPTFHLAAQI